MITDVFLLEGPDGYRYKGLKISEELWEVNPFFNLHKSKWWENECLNYCWKMNKKYSTLELKEKFSILATSKTFYKPSNLIVHYD